MSMNPRTLRPSSTFSPRSISGLALWLDASSSDLYTTDAGPVVAVASPLDIAGCVGWWDASEASTLFAADTGDTLATTTVGRWADKSVAGINLTQPTSGSRPTATASAVNGRTALTFDGTDFLSAATSVALGDNTVIMVVREDVAVSYAGLFAYYPATGNDNLNANGWVADLQLSDNIITLNSGPNSAQWVGATALPISVVTLRRQIAAGDRQMIRANGITQAVNASASTGTAAGILLGGRFQSGAVDTLYRARITVCEIVRWDRALSAAEYASVEAYLAAKWGISGVHAPATASSDPVGYWGDRSGNGRHAVQSLAESRPSRSVAINTRSAVLLANGAVQRLTVNGVYMDALGDDTNKRITIFAALQSSSQSQQKSIGEVDQSSGFGCYHNISNIAYFDAGAGAPASRASGALASSVITGGAIFIGRRDGGAVDQWYNGALIAGSLTSATGSLRTAGDNPFSVKAVNSGSLAYGEVLVYNRALTTTERQRAERYLATRWGITLAPQVSNADAQNWIDRVYANGGSVSSATAGAVNQFCVDIENAAGGSIRDRFYRLNLFCGSNLNAALVPLYRGPSLGETQYGGATDTNNGPFVGIGTDYTETGATGGLTGNGTTKYLAPGTMAQLKPSWTTHHFGVDIKNGYPDATNRYQMGAFFNEAPTSPRGAYAMLGTSSSRGGESGTTSRYGFTAAANLKMVVRATASDMRLFEDGTQVGATQATADTATVLPGGQFCIGASSFQSVSNGTPTGILNGYSPVVGTMRGYSIGEGMDSTQCAAFASAWSSLRAALGRNL